MILTLSVLLIAIVLTIDCVLRFFQWHDTQCLNAVVESLNIAQARLKDYEQKNREFRDYYEAMIKEINLRRIQGRGNDSPRA
ncbi:MAG TPA: hypothetical protein VI423_02025 [Paenisporosarcina sp.]|nr:hypothetical protein [Paenisporosarcina sp.]